MSSQSEASFSLLDGGVVGARPRPKQLEISVAPTAAADFNTIRAGLFPLACFRVDSIRFAFDSSVVAPGVRADLARLGELLRVHPPASLARAAQPPRAGSPLSVFGHSDPTGDDEYNKLLSGRRAQAIYALLVRDPDLWEQLYSRPHGSDQWGVRAIETMLAQLGRESESSREIDANRTRRRALFVDYMDSLCGDAVPKLAKGDFLAEGKDARGKGDFQGCGEFNPLLVLSQRQHDAFAKQKDKSARNEANAPNRRVMLLIFREGAKVDPSRWPCPRASEGSAGCRKRFWSDGEKRRSTRLASDERTFEATQDTFACRFYHRHSDRSPCERVLGGLRVRLYAGFGKSIPFAPFSVTVEGEPPTPLDRADGSGVIAVRGLKAPASCEIRWGFPPARGQEPELLFSRKIFLVPEQDKSPEATIQRLTNLGYDDPDRRENAVAFQFDYGHLATPPLAPTGELDAPTAALVERIYAEAADDLRGPPRG